MRWHLRGIFTAAIVFAATTCCLPSQVLQAAAPLARHASDDLASVTGRFQLPAEPRLEVNLESFEAHLVENIQLPPPPLPDSWAEMTNEERAEWYQEFLRSEEGQQFQRERAQRLAERRVYPIEVRDDGRFFLDDVVAGSYSLTGSMQHESASGRKYILSVEALVEVRESVEEVQLEELPLDVLTLLQRGDRVPRLELRHLDERPLRIEPREDEFLLVEFWATWCAPCMSLKEEVDQVHRALEDRSGQLRVVSITLDAEPGIAREQVQQHRWAWTQGFAGSWDHEVVRGFGVAHVPSFWLIRPDGRIMLSDEEIDERLEAGDRLIDIIEPLVTDSRQARPQREDTRREDARRDDPRRDDPRRDDRRQQDRRRDNPRGR